MKKIFALPIALVFIACGSEPTQNEPTETTDTTTVVMDSIPTSILAGDTLAEATDTLQLPEGVEEYFSAAWVAKADAYLSAFHQINTTEDFKQVFALAEEVTSLGSTELEGIIEKMYGENIDDPSFVLDKELEFIKPHLAGIVFTFAAEGTIILMSMDYQQLSDKAALTEGDEDDKLMELLITAWGTVEYEGSNMGTWFVQTWDYGGSSGLGSGTHLKLFQLMEGMEDSPYRDEIAKIRDLLIGDMLEFNSYWESQEAILEELNKIINGFVWSAEMLEKLENRVTQFEAYEDHELELNCKEGNCGYG